jgi:hypothetical protein
MEEMPNYSRLSISRLKCSFFAQNGKGHSSNNYISKSNRALQEFNLISPFQNRIRLQFSATMAAVVQDLRLSER